MENSHISFVMPAYNSKKTISEAIESVMQTNFHNGDEMIIVNDASVDNTREVIARLQSKYPRIQCIDNTVNLGCPAARNVGIRASKNPLIFNMDSDDVLAEHSVTPLKQYFIENDADIASFAESRFFQKTTKKITHKWVIKGGILTLADFLSGPIIPGGNYLYTKASWQKIGGYWEYGKGLHEYWGFTFKQLANGAKFVVLSDSYYFHRYGYNSMSIKARMEENASAKMATRMITNHVDLIHPDDLEYIASGENWLDQMSTRPIRLKSGKIGVTGHRVVFKRNNEYLETFKRYIPRFIFIPFKKIYQYIQQHI